MNNKINQVLGVQVRDTLPFPFNVDQVQKLKVSVEIGIKLHIPAEANYLIKAGIQNRNFRGAKLS